MLNQAQDAMYGVAGKKLNNDLLAVENGFMLQLANLSMMNASQCKMLSFVLKDRINNRGEIAEKGVPASNKSIIDICKLTPLLPESGSKNILEEVAKVRLDMLNVQLTPEEFKKLAPIFMIDYLLSACVCYVEVFGEHVDKFFATRNRFIAASVAGIPPEETLKYTEHLAPYIDNYKREELRVLKLSSSKGGAFKITQPRSGMSFTKNVKVTPLFFMTTFLNGIIPVMRENYLRFMYVKDNGQMRDFTTTLNSALIGRYYPSEVVSMMLAGVKNELQRGYVKLPEMGISRFDDTGVRALNVSRITQIDVVPGFDARFIDIDFNNIIPEFKKHINSINDLRYLKHILSELTRKPAPDSVNSVIELRMLIENHVDNYVAIGSTMALREIHLYMLDRPKIFQRYNGGRPKEFTGDTSIFGGGGFSNLGGVND